MAAPEPIEIGRALGNWATEVGKALIMTTTVASLLGGIGWAIGKPFAKEVFKVWLEEAHRPTFTIVSSNAEAIRDMREALDRIDERRLLEINGAPIIFPPATVSPGNTIPIGYHIKRTEACETEIIVQFISGRLQRVDTSLTYTIPATQSRVSDEYGLFIADVRVPRGVALGFYSYAPDAIPINCNGHTQRVQIPPSPFFEVVAED